MTRDMGYDMIDLIKDLLRLFRKSDRVTEWYRQPIKTADSYWV